MHGPWTEDFELSNIVERMLEEIVCRCVHAGTCVNTRVLHTTA